MPDRHDLARSRTEVAELGAATAFAAARQRALDGAELGAFVALAEPTDTADATRSAGPAAGGPGIGALAGIPFAVKDNIDTEQLTTGAGTPALRASRPGRDHPAVGRLLGAGAALLGKTNMHELAFGITSNNAACGPVRNPTDPGRSAGGSSGGSAVAVATGVVPFALGTDTGGSVRLPSAYCGVVGFRPTVGRWGDGGRTVPLSSTRDTVGVSASTVADVALIDTVITGRRDDRSAPERLRVGLPRKGFHDDLDADVAAVTGRALDRLADAGVDLVDIDFPQAHPLDAECGFPIVLYEVAQELPRYLASLSGPERELTAADVLAAVASPDVAELLGAALAGAYTKEQYSTALEIRDVLRGAYRAALSAEQPTDALVYPTSPILPPPLGDDTVTAFRGREVPVFATVARNTLPGSAAGMPAITLPAGTAASGLPVGLSLESLPHTDGRLLAVASTVERLLAGTE